MTRKTILQLSHEEACAFLLKAESFCNLELPPYLVFGTLLDRVNQVLAGKQLSTLSSKPRDHDDVNYTILNNKDGKYAWRPFQLIHPALYVSLVHKITSPDNWKLITDRFEQFTTNEKIRCLSVPVISTSEQKDKAAQVSHWWQEVEQRSIELSLDFAYLIETDITDCYGAIYTHSIAWALHTKSEAKQKRGDRDLIGNVIDSHIQDMRHGQTNGIPQGSALMDFIAEMVLGFADLELSDEIKSAGIDDYCILRYHDDYRIFVNNPQDGERITKLLSEATGDLGLKLNPAKTTLSSDVVRAAIKSDKRAWLGKKQTAKSLQRHLLIIHDHAVEFPNSGSLVVALYGYHQRLSRTKKLFEQPMPLIAIVVDIAFHNPRTYAICAALLSHLLSFLADADEKGAVVDRVRKRFSRIPNTGHMQIWLQRVTISIDPSIKYEEPLCALVAGDGASIWNMDWITSKDLKTALDVNAVVDKSVLEGIGPVIPSEEVELFISKATKGYY